jgi:hypothetical protein
MLSEVYELRKWAFHLAARKRGEKERAAARGAPKSGPPRDAAFDVLLQNLTDIFQQTWGAKLNLTPSKEAPSKSKNAAGVAYEVAVKGELLDELCEAGEPVPVGFGRYLCEVLHELKRCGIPVPTKPGSVRRAWERMRKATLPDHIRRPDLSGISREQMPWALAAKEVGVDFVAGDHGSDTGEKD